MAEEYHDCLVVGGPHDGWIVHADVNRHSWTLATRPKLVESYADLPVPAPVYECRREIYHPMPWHCDGTTKWILRHESIGGHRVLGMLFDEYHKRERE